MLYLQFLNHDLCNVRIAPDDPRHAAARELALEAIAEIDRQVEAAETAARHVWPDDCGEDEDPEPIPNDGPWETLEEIARLAARNPNVVAELKSQGRIDLVARYLDEGA